LRFSRAAVRNKRSDAKGGRQTEDDTRSGCVVGVDADVATLYLDADETLVEGQAEVLRQSDDGLGAVAAYACDQDRAAATFEERLRMYDKNLLGMGLKYNKGSDMSMPFRGVRNRRLKR